ncbi:MAG TPA: peptide chain release factor N(5)-glutamine methyltransferase [Bryobacteraceae bacterium]|nr:peptide chain release factor N(5)-glutamine methyltransferase [Bryobacteraceae bacterium]
MTIGTALLQGARRLEAAGVAVPRLTAEVLLAWLLGRERVYLFAHPEAELTAPQQAEYEDTIERRLDGAPTQYITGRQEFWGREFRVTADVLIPRPETEHVVETAMELARGACRIVDAGCGSGILAVTLRLETGAEAWGTDISTAALAVARDNARRLGAPVRFVACDLLSGLADASFDLVVSNPPYVPDGDRPGLQREVRDYEPHVALFAGPTGYEIYERLVADARRVLRPGGWLIMELGFGTYQRVLEMLGCGWKSARTVPDLAGIPRVAAAQLAPL